jgi:predicted Zn-dependent protease with MMP-like domain
MGFSETEFQDLVARAVESLPPEFLERMENVDVVTAPEPTRRQRQENGLRSEDTLLGLYEGIPLTERTHYNLVAPDKITIFQRPIESIFRTEADIIAAVQETVRHEIAHHFGISDERLEELRGEEPDHERPEA